MGNVTYLFGAGASCQCLPVVKEFDSRFEQFRDELQKLLDGQVPSLPDLPQFNYAEILKEIIELVNIFLPDIKAHASVDTFAKKLTIQQRWNDYYWLKIILSLYFMYEQRGDRKDERYDTFFAAILGQSASPVNDNIRILSWNYDIQFEKAY